MFLMQRLSVAMQRGNAACILGTIADDDFSTEFFVYTFFTYLVILMTTVTFWTRIILINGEKQKKIKLYDLLISHRLHSAKLHKVN